MRADKFFAQRFGSRTKAAQALKIGLVLRAGRPLSPDDEVEESAGEECFTFLRPEEEFVSRGGEKLARGLDFFGVSVEGQVFADLGASTGGFTQCLLRRGAGKVFCVDVGQSQLAPSLRADSRVCVMDGTNARYLRPEHFPVPLDGVVCDLSFISLRLILPAVAALLSAGGRVFALFKPQFECGKQGVNKNGICPTSLHPTLLAQFYDFCCGLSLSPRSVVNAPVHPRKNVEYVLFLERDGVPVNKERFLQLAKISKNI